MSENTTGKRVRVRCSRLQTEQQCIAEMSKLYGLARHGKLSTADLTRYVQAITQVHNALTIARYGAEIEQMKAEIESHKLESVQANVVRLRAMSNSNNLGKELKRVRKELDELKSKDRRFHYVVVDASTSEEERIAAMTADGTMKKGDEFQVIHIPWTINELKGSSQIPESSSDPYAEPKLPPREEVSNEWAEQREREERWKKHVKKIERDGTRYEGDKPKKGTQWL